MIFGRSTNLWLGLITSGLALVQLIAVQVLPDADPKVIATILGGVGLFLGAAISLIANGTPTVNSGDPVNVVTPKGQDNKTVTVS